MDNSTWLWIVGTATALAAAGLMGIRLLAWKRKARRHASEREAALGQMARMNDTFVDIRAQRHDMMMHVGAIHYLLESGQYDEAKDYLEQLVSTYDTVHESIKGEHGHMSALLYPVRLQAEKSGVAVLYNLELPLSAMPLSHVDQIRLLGNLLHNALDAASAAAEAGAESRIKLQSSRAGGHYMIELSNTSTPVPAYLLDKLYTTGGASTKGGSHEGLGTYTIGQIVRSNKGKLDYKWDAPEFYVKIKLPIIEGRRLS